MLDIDMVASYALTAEETIVEVMNQLDSVNVGQAKALCKIFLRQTQGMRNNIERTQIEKRKEEQHG